MMVPMLRHHDAKLEVWDDSEIRPGDKWLEVIEAKLATARVALLLVSVNFLASEFVMRKEVPSLLRAAKDDGLPILWVSLSHCMWEHTSLRELQAALPPNQPLAELDRVDQDNALKTISLEIEKAMARQEASTQREMPPLTPGQASLVATPIGQDLDVLWKNIVSLIELPSSRMLFLPQAKLLRLDSDQAYVGISGTWMAMVQSRLPFIETAIAIAVGSRRVHLLQLAEASAPPADPDPDET